jgi:RNA polymerase sigma factor (sigma-70 family)
MTGPVSTPSDRVALNDFGDDDASRWDTVARLYSKPLTRFFANRVRNPADAEDLVQKVFVRVLQRVHGEPIEHVQRYLFQVATSVLNDERRSARLRQEEAHQSYDESLHPLRTEITPETVLLGQETVARVVAALRELPERTREVYFLRAMRRHKFSEIAERMGLSKRAVQGHMARALMHLSTVLNDGGNAASPPADSDD